METKNKIIKDNLKLPEDVRHFIYAITLDLQQHRSKTPKQLDMMFQDAYKLYAKYDVEGWNAKNCPHRSTGAPGAINTCEKCGLLVRRSDIGEWFIYPNNQE